MADDTVVLETKGLDQLIKALKNGMPRACVGILGSKTIRGKTQGNQTNAAIGAIHEYGSPAKNIPIRSFLRVPISEHLNKKMESSGALDETVLKEVVKSGTVVPWLKKIAILAESVVHEAFETGGFGKWPGWKNPNYKNNHGRILEDTGQLRDSITSEVK